MSYDIHQHQHRFAAWAAASAASVVGARFSVKSCVGWIEAIQLNELKRDDLPEPEAFDPKHLEWRNGIIDAAGGEDFGAQQKGRKETEMSHGQAAKIINVYMKARFLNPKNEKHPKVAAIHPPIDRLLLNEIIKKKALSQGDLKEIRSFRDAGWSKLNSHEYERLIEILRSLTNPRPFWTIEEYWPGFQ